jgi:hypothetical protein
VSMKNHEDRAVLLEKLAEILVADAGTNITITEQDCIGVVWCLQHRLKSIIMH